MTASRTRMRHPLVSIITPTYNHSGTIAACLRSVIAQSFTDWEQVVVDDGSRDETWNIMRSVAHDDARIHCVRQEHRGIGRLAETYNDALSKCRGRYVAIIEGDDLWPADKLEHQVGIHAADESLVLSHGRTLTYKDGAIIGRYPEPPSVGRSDCHAYLRLALLRRSCIMPVSVVISRDALCSIGGFTQDEGLPAVDYPTWLRLFSREGHVWFDSKVLGYWRQSPSQATQQYGLDLATAGLRVALNHFHSLPDTAKAVLRVSDGDLEKAHWARDILPSTLVALRRALMARKRREAIEHSLLMIRRGGPKRSIEGIAGLICAALGWDLEGVFSAIDGLQRLGTFVNPTRPSGDMLLGREEECHEERRKL